MDIEDIFKNTVFSKYFRKIAVEKFNVICYAV